MEDGSTLRNYVTNFYDVDESDLSIEGAIDTLGNLLFKFPFIKN